MSNLTDSALVRDHVGDEEKTVPNSPEVANIYHGDFARLIPSNRTARLAFDEVADKLGASGSEWSGTGLEKYMHIEDGKVNLGDDIVDTDSETIFNTEPKTVWAGYYRLNMEIPPSNTKLGWVVGRGRSDLGKGGVDFLLTSRTTYDVAGRYARLYHNSSSKVLMIIAGRRPIVLNGTLELKDDQRAITATNTGISFGDLTYRLDFTALDSNSYTRQLRHDEDAGEAVPAYMSPTPLLTDYTLRDYAVKIVFAEGSTCVLSSGIDTRSGAFVAIKEMKRNARNSSALAHEVEINKAISPHPRICQLKDVIYPNNRNTEQLGPNNVDKVYMIYSPLGRSNLQHLILSDLSIQNRILVFEQCLEGVAYIHSKKLMHRDIKPGNMIIISQNPPNVMLIDFGQATWKETSTNHMVGTISYLAPEAIALKRGLEVRAYDNRVDIRGLGLCGYQLFCYQTHLWQEINGKEYQTMVKRLSEPPLIVNPLFYLISALLLQMLAWESPKRISAAEALKDPTFRKSDIAEESTTRASSEADVPKKRRLGT